MRSTFQRMDCTLNWSYINYGELHCDSVKIADKAMITLLGNDFWIATVLLLALSRFHHQRRPRIPKYKKKYFDFTHAFSKVNFHSTEGQTFFWSIMTADDCIKINVDGWTQAWQAKWAVFKVLGSVCKHFLPNPTPPLHARLLYIMLAFFRAF